MQDTVPKQPNGDLDYQTMADDLGIADLGEVSRVFITDNTGIVRRVINTNLNEGTVRLRDETTGLEYATSLNDLWSKWRWDDLTYVDRVFLHHNEFAVTEEHRPHVETVVEYIQSEIDASEDTLPDDIQNGIKVIAGLLDA